jgi:hypothetical protein
MSTKWKPWHQVVQLREELKTGELSLAMFAADLDEVILQKNKRPLYEDASKFFSLTYPTYNLKQLARDVVRRLAGKSDKAVRQLNLTYGGGKTHALITLCHLSRDPENLPNLHAIEEFRVAIDLDNPLPKARIAAISFDKLDLETGMEVLAPDGKKARFFHPWTILAWQLAGKHGVEILNGGKGMTERDTAPAENVMLDLLGVPEKEGLSTLILLDEVLMYARPKVVDDQKWMIKLQNFFQSLTQAAVKTDRCAIVASLLASELDQFDQVGKQITTHLKDVFSRQQEEPVEPVVKEDVAEVLRRRFFEAETTNDNKALRPHAMAAFKGLQAHDEATKRGGQQAEKRFVESYPFHPDLTDVFYSKWVNLDQFQRTRGVLRIFAMALRESAGWDPCPVIGPNAFLRKAGDTGLGDALRDLVGIADSQSSDGHSTAWTGILDRELGFAREIQRDYPSLTTHLEIEQAVLAVFFHSQPTGLKASLRDLTLLVAPTNPDRIEFGKGLQRWAQESYWLDDKFTEVEAGKVPETWRLGNIPNLTQIHREKRREIESEPMVIESRLLDAVRSLKKLKEGAQAYGVITHMLPENPADVTDDGKFHFAVLGPDAASESGKPSTTAVRFLEETTSAAKPWVYRNAVVLVCPSRDGLEAARSRIVDLLAWEQVGHELDLAKKDGSVDPQRLQRYSTEIATAKGKVPDAIRQAWCMTVTVAESNQPQAFKLQIADEGLFTTVKNDPKGRMQETSVTAETLLPDGPYDLWQEGDEARRVKDLAGSFAQLPHLPKMLSTSAILDTLVEGCLQGSFVLRLRRPDGSARTWWRTSPDDEAIKDPDLEVVLTESAELTELPSDLLRPGALPELWDGDSLTVGQVRAYFDGTHTIDVGHSQTQAIPKLSTSSIDKAISNAVEAGDVWFLSGPTSLLKEAIPAGVITDTGELRPVPEAIAPAALLEGNISAAWDNGEANAAAFLTQLSSLESVQLPWTLVSEAIACALRARLIELRSDPGTWPCGVGSASHARFRATGVEPPVGGEDSSTVQEKGQRFRAQLTPDEIQDLADNIHKLTSLQAQHHLDMRILITLVIESSDGETTPEIVGAVREVLKGISDSFNG